MEAARNLVAVQPVLLVAVQPVQLMAVECSNAQTICNVCVNDLPICKPNPTSPTQTCCSVLPSTNLGCLCSNKQSNLVLSLGSEPNLVVCLPAAKCRAEDLPCAS